MLQKFNELDRIDIFVFKLAITVVLWFIPIKWNKGRMNQLEFLVQPYLGERKRKHEC